MITSTGNKVLVPFSSGIFFGGSHRSHWAASPVFHTILSDGSFNSYSGRIRATFSRNHDADPVQSTRSASTVAGISGVAFINARILASTVANDVSTGVRTYSGGACDFTALITVVREIPNRAAIRACGTPCPASLLISALSSKVITLPIVVECSLATGETVQFPSGVDIRVRWEIRDDIHEAFMSIACSIICYRRLSK